MLSPEQDFLGISIVILCSVLDTLLMFFNTTLISAKPNNIVEVLDGLKSFTVLRDMGCCSTANPIFAAGYGIRIVNCGLPQLSMHRSFYLLQHSSKYGILISSC
jgi:uncharacterized membrane protein YqiK